MLAVDVDVGRVQNIINAKLPHEEYGTLFCRLQDWDANWHHEGYDSVYWKGVKEEMEDFSGPFGDELCIHDPKRITVLGVFIKEEFCDAPPPAMNTAVGQAPEVIALKASWRSLRRAPLHTGSWNLFQAHIGHDTNHASDGYGSALGDRRASNRYFFRRPSAGQSSADSSNCQQLGIMFTTWAMRLLGYLDVVCCAFQLWLRR